MNDTRPGRAEQRLIVDGVQIEMVRRGRGKPLVWLHSVDGVKADSPFFEQLSQQFDVLAPWHPGFGHSDWPKEFRTMDDLAYFYLTLTEQLGIRDAVLAGSAFGGWLAAEIAVRSTAAFSHLILVNAFGIKVGDRYTRDIADLHAISQDEMTKLAYHDPAKRVRDYSTMAEADLVAIARSRQAYTHYGWKPYMHNPTLKRWLRRIRIPTLVVWGASDGIVKPDYGRAYAAAIPGARFELIHEAGHHPHTEQPETLARLMVEFARTAPAPAKNIAQGS